MASLVDALTPGITSRQRIFDANLRSYPSNKPIRRALGLREVGRSEATLPKFACPEVRRLYQRIDRIAVDRLPVYSIDALHQAWHAGTYKDEIREVAVAFSKIWKDALNVRRPGT
jgi:hypothetical protein